MANVVNFIPSRRLIEEIDVGGDNQINIDEIYSEWKVWYAIGDNSKYSPAMRTVGGDEISAVQDLGATFFLINGWRFKPAERTHRLTLTGNWFTDPSGDFTTVATDGNYQVLVSEAVSNLTDSSVARLDLAQLQKFVYLDDTLGDDANNGTPRNPVLTISRAFEIADTENLKGFSISGTYTLDRASTGWAFVGTVSPDSATINLGGYSVDACRFEAIEMTGQGLGVISASRVKMTSLEGVSGLFHDSGLSSLIRPGDGTNTILHNCFSEIAGISTPIVDLGDLESAELQLRGYSGGVEIRNIDVVGQDVSVDLNSGHLVLHSSCDNGICVIRGIGKLTDNSTGTVIDRDGFIDARDVEANRKIYSNRQKIDVSSQTLKIYDDDGVTVIFEYDLYDRTGAPTTSAIFERVPK